MAHVIFSTNEIEVIIDRVDQYEAKVMVNDSVLIWISRDEQDKFEREFGELLEKYRI